MTREEAKELLPILQAFAEDKQIQDKIDVKQVNGLIYSMNLISL